MSLIPKYVAFVDGTITVTLPQLGSCNPGTATFSAPKPDLSLRIETGNDLLVESPPPPKDHQKWSDIKKSGFIKMTPLLRSRSKTEYFVVGLPVYSFDLRWHSCQDATRVYGQQWTVVNSWVEQYTGYSSVLADKTAKSDEEPPDIEAELNSLRSQVVTANLQTYDVLTDLAEAKQTAQMILSIIKSVRSPLKSFIDFKKSLERNPGKLSPVQVKKAVERKWMEVRYGIMPAVYSIKDAANLIKERNNVFKTDRAHRDFRYTVGAVPDPSLKGVYSYTREEVHVQLSAVAKAMYNPEQLQLRLLDQLGINPFVTAWELVPLSFVVDWFANVGDWVLAQTSALSDGASQRLMCQSIKETRVKTTYLYANVDYSAERVFDSTHIMKAGPINVKSQHSPLKRVTTESYSRSLFVPSDVNLQLDVFLNWKRMIDAWCLSQKPIISGLRSLKRA